MKLVHPCPVPEYAPDVAAGGYTDAINDRARRSQLAWETGECVDRFRTVGDAKLVSEIRRTGGFVCKGDRFALVELAARCLALAERADRERDR